MILDLLPNAFLGSVPFYHHPKQPLRSLCQILPGLLSHFPLEHLNQPPALSHIDCLFLLYLR